MRRRRVRSCGSAVTCGRTRDIRSGLDDHARVRGAPDSPDRQGRTRIPRDRPALPDPQSVAEVAVLLGLPLTVTKILIGDLIADGHLITRSAAALPPTDLSELDLLRTVLDGIRKL
ncbi:DUF742 domain-containing protein [Nocardia sp. CA-151230]|uniref:DUF742 domain-containing protein n=1 Tax=Nocardia sp. CA-151230 TaxID=3239982 RepID=UPI003D8E94B3